jgi:hypothetical protein
MVALLLCLLQEAGFPLQEGARWTYGSSGRETLILEVKPSTGPFRHRQRMQVLGGEPVWLLDEIAMSYVAGQEAGVFLGSDRPVSNGTLIPSKFKEGLHWDMLRADATLVARESVIVPAGTFDAWRLEYLPRRAIYKDEGMVSFWYVPGTGLVKLRVEQGAAWPPSSPPAYEYELLRAELDGKHRPATPIPPPLLPPEQETAARRLIGLLNDDDAPVREDAGRRLKALGRGILPLLQETRPDSLEAADRIRDLIAALGTVEFVARVTSAEIVAGGILPIEFRICNFTRSPVTVIPCLAFSDCGQRFPHYRIEIQDAGRRSLEQPPAAPPGDRRRLSHAVLVDIPPGEDFDPFGPGSQPHRLLLQAPLKPGTYTLTCVYDNRSWPGFQDRPQTMVSGPLVSNQVTLTVKP